jgi:hypothetical protein
MMEEAVIDWQRYVDKMELQKTLGFVDESEEGSEEESDEQEEPSETEETEEGKEEHGGE